MIRKIQDLYTLLFAKEYIIITGNKRKLSISTTYEDELLTLGIIQIAATGVTKSIDMDCDELVREAEKIINRK